MAKLKKSTAKKKASRKKSAKDGGGKVRSIRALGRAVGRSDTTVRKWMARPDWPFGGKPPWDPVEVKAWSITTLSQNPEEFYRETANQLTVSAEELDRLPPERRAKLLLILERTLAVRQQREERAGRLHDVEGCRRRRVSQIHAAKARLLDLPRQLSTQLSGQTPEQIEASVARALREALEALADD